MQAAGSWYLTDAVNVRDIGYSLQVLLIYHIVLRQTEVLWYAYDPTTKPVTNGVVDVGSTPTPGFYTGYSRWGFISSWFLMGQPETMDSNIHSSGETINGASEVWLPRIR